MAQQLGKIDGKMNAPKLDFYDQENSKVLCGYAADTYAKRRSVPGYCDVFTVPATDGKVVVYYLPDDVVIAFQGTTDLAGWVRDGDVRQITENDCQMHEGFCEVTTSLEGFIRDDTWGARRIWVTGHSLGGACAVYWAWRQVYKAGRNPFSGIYTFGQPRIGNSEFRDSWTKLGLNPLTFRIVNEQDLIPRVPEINFRHVHQHCVFYPFNNISHPVIDPSLLTLIENDVEGLAVQLWEDKFGLFADHHILNYLALFNQPPSPAANAGLV